MPSLHIYTVPPVYPAVMGIYSYAALLGPNALAMPHLSAAGPGVTWILDVYIATLCFTLQVCCLN